AGVAEVHGLGSFFHFFGISADGWAPANASYMAGSDEGGVREIAVTLSRGAALEGTVVDPSGQPVAQASVRLSANADWQRTTTDAHGVWRFAIVAAGSYDLGA